MVDDEHQGDDIMAHLSAGRNDASEEEEDRQPALSGRQLGMLSTLSPGGVNVVDNAEGIRARALAYGTKAVAVSSNKQLTSKFRGVCWNKKNKRWQAAINSSGKYLYLGSYNTEAEAAAVFDKAAIRIRGLKARLNFCYSDYVDADGKIREDHAIDELLQDACNPAKSRRHRTAPQVAVLSDGSPPAAPPQSQDRPQTAAGSDSPAAAPAPARSGGRRRRAPAAAAGVVDSDGTNWTDEQEPPLRRQRRGSGSPGGGGAEVRRVDTPGGAVGTAAGADAGVVAKAKADGGRRGDPLAEAEAEAGSGDGGVIMGAGAAVAPGALPPSRLDPEGRPFVGYAAGARDGLGLGGGGGGGGLLDPTGHISLMVGGVPAALQHSHQHQLQPQLQSQLQPDPYLAHGLQAEGPNGGLLSETWSAGAAAVHRHLQENLRTMGSGSIPDVSGDPYIGVPDVGVGVDRDGGGGAGGGGADFPDPFLELNRSDSLHDQMAQLRAEQASLALARLRNPTSGRAAFELGLGGGQGGSLGCGDDAGGGGGGGSVLDIGFGAARDHRRANSKLLALHRLAGGGSGDGPSSRASGLAELLMNVVGGGGDGGDAPTPAGSWGWGNGSLASRLRQSSAQLGLGRAAEYGNGSNAGQPDLLEQLSQQSSFLSNLGLGVLAAARANAVASSRPDALQGPGPQHPYLHQQHNSHSSPRAARPRLGEGQLALLLQPDPETGVAIAGVSTTSALGLPLPAGSSEIGGAGRSWPGGAAGGLHGGGGGAATPQAVERISETVLQSLKHHHHQQPQLGQTQLGASSTGQQHRGAPWLAAAPSRGSDAPSLRAEFLGSQAAVHRPQPHGAEAEAQRQLAAGPAYAGGPSHPHLQAHGHKAATPPGQGVNAAGSDSGANVGEGGARRGAGAGNFGGGEDAGTDGDHGGGGGGGDMFTQIHRALPADCSLDVVIPSSLPNVVGVLYRRRSRRSDDGDDDGGGLMNAAVWNGRVQRLRHLGKFGSEAEAKASCQAALAMLRDTMPLVSAPAGDGDRGLSSAPAVAAAVGQKAERTGTVGRQAAGGVGSKDGASGGRGGGGGTAAAALSLGPDVGGDGRVDRAANGAGRGQELDLTGGAAAGGGPYPSYKIVVPSSDELSYSQRNGLQFLSGSDGQGTPSSHQLLAITLPLHHGGLHGNGAAGHRVTLDSLGYRLEPILLGRMGQGAGHLAHGNRLPGADGGGSGGVGDLGMTDGGGGAAGGAGSRNSAVTQFMHCGTSGVAAAAAAAGGLPAPADAEGELTDESIVTERRQGREGSGSAGVLGFGWDGTASGGGLGANWSGRAAPRGSLGLFSLGSGGGGEGSGGCAPHIADSSIRSGSCSRGSGGGRRSGAVHTEQKDPTDDAFTEAVLLRGGSASGGGGCGQRPRAVGMGVGMGVSGAFSSEFSALTQLANVDVQEALQLFFNQQQR